MEFILKFTIIYILSIVFGFFGLLYLRKQKVIYDVDDYLKLIFVPFVNTALSLFGMLFIIPTIYNNIKEIYYMIKHLIQEAIEMYKYRKKEKELNNEENN